MKVNSKIIYIMLAVCLLVGCKKSDMPPEFTQAVDALTENPSYSTILSLPDNGSLIQDDGGVYLKYTYLDELESIGLAESADGINWSDPVVCMEFHDTLSWATDLKSPTVCRRDDLYCMFFAGHYDNGSWIGFAISIDARKWTQVQSMAPVVSPDLDWELEGVTSPVVIWDDDIRKFKMWYGAGLLDEPSVIGYAESPDGFDWEKQPAPVLSPNAENKWEEKRIVPYLVIRNSEKYILFYKGYDNNGNTKIGAALSDDGISNWVRSKKPLNLKIR